MSRILAVMVLGAATSAVSCGALFSYPSDASENCTNGSDDDFDGDADCRDADCAGHAACTEATAEACSNGLDDDGDGDIDCADPDCVGPARCVENSRALCSNGLDDDGDGDIDCADATCDGVCQETGPACFDQRDNDGDGLTDHRDAACWTSANVSFDRCAAVEGSSTEFGAELGLDWYAESIEDLPQAVVTEAGRPALVGLWRAQARSTAAPNGRVAKTAVDVGAALATSTFAELVVAIGPPDGARVEARMHAAWCPNSDALCLFLLPVETTSTAPDDPGFTSIAVLPERYADATLSFRVDATASTVTVTARSGSAISEELRIDVPASWAAAEPLEITWRGASGGGVSWARFDRETHERCGAQFPAPAMTTSFVRSVAWMDDGELCLLASGLWSTRVTEAGKSLGAPRFANAGPADLRVIAWDPTSRSLLGLTQTFYFPGQPLTTRWVRAQACAGPWEDLGEAEAVLSEGLVPVSYTIQGDGTRALHAVAAINPANLSEPLVRYLEGDGTPGSLRPVGEAVALSLDVGGAARIGGEWIHVAGRGGSLELRVAGASAPLATFDPRGEAGAFDRFGAPANTTLSYRRPFEAALVMDPAPSDGAPWHGLLFYTACTFLPCEAQTRAAPAWVSIERSP